MFDRSDFLCVDRFDIAILPIAGQTVRNVYIDQVTTQSVIPWKPRTRGYREFVTKHSDLISHALNLLLVGWTCASSACDPDHSCRGWRDIVC